MDVEQRARAVFGLSWADYWMERGQPDVAHDFDAFSRAEAWALQHFPAALTPPEGYVLVPVEPTEAMVHAGLNAPFRGHPETGGPSLPDMWTAMLAARPEVKP